MATKTVTFDGKKVKLSLCLIKNHAIKIMGEWRYSSTILDLGTKLGGGGMIVLGVASASYSGCPVFKPQHGYRSF
jgi:hypothetical protein